MTRYRKKPVVIDAWQTGQGTTMPDWLTPYVLGGALQDHGDYALIETLEGTMRANEGDWIIQGIKGEIYPCKPEIFAAIYEEVTE